MILDSDLNSVFLVLLYCIFEIEREDEGKIGNESMCEREKALRRWDVGVVEVINLGNTSSPLSQGLRSSLV